MSDASTIPRMLDERAAAHPDAVAVLTPQGSMTYAGLVESSTTRANRLIGFGARKGTVIVLLLPNGTEWVAWWAACARIGAVVVPVNTFATPTELRRILEHSGAHLLVAIPEFGERAYRRQIEEELGVTDPERDRIDSTLPQLRRIVWLGGDEATPSNPEDRAIVDALAADVVPADVLTIIYSSGSTGDPKGVVHSHGATMRQATRLADLTQSESTSVLWTSMPLNWVGGLVWSFLRTIVAGGTFVTQERFEPGAALALIEAAGVDTIAAWGAGSEQLRTHPSYDQEVFGNVRGLGVLIPGDPSRPSALGMTETLGPHSGWFGQLDEPVPAGASGSMGQTLPGLQARIVEPGTDREVPAGETGELLIRGSTVMLGIHRREPGDVFTEDGWYATGDAVCQRQGWLFFRGRLDDVIKTNGANVSPAEVEAALRLDPAVEQAFVLGVPHPDRGQDVGAVVVAAGGALDHDALLATVREQLASFKVPRHVRVIAEADVPWLSSQKVDRKRLRALIEQGGLP